MTTPLPAGRSGRLRPAAARDNPAAGTVVGRCLL